RRPAPALFVGALALVLGAALAVADFGRVAAIFSAAPGSPPLEQRIAAGQRSVLFSHHADYAAVTSGLPISGGLQAFGGASHYLLDTRLMVAWAKALAQDGQVDAARHLAQRLREFRSPLSQDFFAACDASAAASAAAAPFQCSAPQQALSWRDFEAR
ncbi:MAG: polymerase, partial [Rubrivivax sp.]|nr:polymerase [Rubrivivax sp.]